MTISFATSAKDAALISAIVDRAVAMAPEMDRMDTAMDITATHCNGCPLDLQRLLEADDFNFAHDLYGIARHLDRTTDKLTDCFSPRTSRHED